MHVYIHVPFCKSICNYCDFCKFYYNKDWAKDYLIALEKEIEKRYKNEFISTIYIGGGTPSIFSVRELKTLFRILKMFKMKNLKEFTFEMNPCDINEEKLQLLKENNVTRLSIGVQSFNNKTLKYLGRDHDKNTAINKICLAKKYIPNINVDIIYAVPTQSLKEIKKDLRTLKKLDVAHISAYSLIIEPNTKLYINNTKSISEDNDYMMYKTIQKRLERFGYNQYEISNYSKKGYKSTHNLGYWDYDDYYGFGVGAHSLIKGYRIENTRDIKNYIDGEYILKKQKLSKKEQIEEYIMLGLRKISGINKNDFKKRFNKNLEEAISVTPLEKNNEEYKISKEKLYIMNEIIIKILPK